MQIILFQKKSNLFHGINHTEIDAQPLKFKINSSVYFEVGIRLLHLKILI